MKILLVHNFYQYRGGEDDYVDILFNLLINKGHNVYLYSQRSAEIVGFKRKIAIGTKLLFSANSEISKIISKFCPDICHIHNIFPGINFSIINECYKRKIPIIQTVHDYRYLCISGNLYRNNKPCDLCIKKSRFFGIFNKCYHSSILASSLLTLALKINRSAIYKTQCYIFPNKYSKNLFDTHLHIQNNKSIIIPHYIPNILQQKIPIIKKYFIYLGRLSPEKGILDIINFFKNNDQMKLVIIGEGPLSQYISTLKQKNISYRGYVSKRIKYKLIHNALFSIIPSRVEEQGPLTLIESFMCGTPVIVPNLFSFKEKVSKKCGFIYTQSRKNSFSAIIIKASKVTKDMYKKMQETVLNEYRKKYSQEVYYKKLLSVYEKYCIS